MTKVSVNGLKKKIGYYLQTVKQGNSITITERGRPVAMLIPAQNHPNAQVARELSRKGVGSWKGGKPKGASRPAVVKGKPVSQIVLEDRR
jgi:prevent-host-death family protein